MVLFISLPEQYISGKGDMSLYPSLHVIYIPSSCDKNFFTMFYLGLWSRHKKDSVKYFFYFRLPQNESTGNKFSDPGKSSAIKIKK